MNNTPLGFDSVNTPALTPISLSEAQELRNKVRSLQADWQLVVAQAVQSAKVAEALEPRVQDLELRVKVLDEIATKLANLHNKIDELTEVTEALTKLKKKRKP